MVMLNSYARDQFTRLATRVFLWVLLRNRQLHDENNGRFVGYQSIA